MNTKYSINIETVSCPCNTCFWYAQVLAVRNTSRGTAKWRRARAYQKHVLHGQETVSIFIAYLHVILSEILRKNHGTLLYCGRSSALRQWPSLSGGVFLNSVRPTHLMHFHFVILRLNADELLAFVYIFVECTLPQQSPIANRVLHKRQRKLIDVISYVINNVLSLRFVYSRLGDLQITAYLRH